ncbi:MAG: ATP-binding cassette domain-containing protein [Candidatus Binatus sp.]|uniref:ABC transporter ATP-binding protein n=1 Tax=Candidatus Binatus sp. TaxID=2811406 RepID=UPI00271803AC|nr:ATP-binding cassette domain-containing protein [Candidatus Binatus sp.]MDO8434554.1 ATP-binding cassette domain-containing protein [Candidatus Binatus sp.]
MSDQTTNNDGSNAINVRDLRRRFGQQQVLDGVTLDIPAGQITTIVGPSGSGKTVFLKHLNLLLRPDSGQIVIDKIDVTRLRGAAVNAVREKFGMLFQAGALFDSMSVFDNVAFPLVEKTDMARSEIEHRVLETLKAVGLEGMERKYPSQMSGGMQKRAALARALVRRPKILMLDEPTTGLDPSRTGAIHDLIRRTQKNFELTAVMVSHDVPAVFEVSDRVAFLHRGKTHLNGAVDEVMAADDDVFKRFLAGKASGDENEALAG